MYVIVSTFIILIFNFNYKLVYNFLPAGKKAFPNSLQLMIFGCVTPSEFPIALARKCERLGIKASLEFVTHQSESPKRIGIESEIKQFSFLVLFIDILIKIIYEITIFIPM